GLRACWRTRLVARDRAQPAGGPNSPLAGGRRSGPPQPAAPAPGRPADGHDRSSGGALTAVLLALAASVSWGIGDFIGGINTRRLGVFAVLFVSQPPTLVLIAIVVIVRGGAPRPGLWMVAGIVAGLAGLVGLSAVYRGMAIGVISVVSTIAATGPVVPILVGLVLGERPTALQFFGIALALGGIGLLAFDRRPAQSGGRLLPGVGLALVAALAFGLFLVAIRYASRPDPVWGVLATRTGSVAALLLLAVAFRSRVKVALPDLPPRVVVGDADPQGAARVHELQPRDQLGRVMVAVSRKDLVPRQPARDGLRSMGRPGQRHGWHPVLELRRCRDPVDRDAGNLLQAIDQASHEGPLVVADAIHGQFQRRPEHPVSAADRRQVLEGAQQTREAFVVLCSRLPAARHLVGRRPDLVGTQSLKQRAPSVENPLVRTEELVARTDEKVAIDGANIDRPVRPVMNRI